MNRDIVVRPAALADLDALADLYARMYRPYWDWSREPGETDDDLREQYRMAFARRLGAEKSDRL